jgi:hypothetical protein
MHISFLRILKLPCYCYVVNCGHFKIKITLLINCCADFRTASRNMLMSYLTNLLTLVSKLTFTKVAGPRECILCWKQVFQEALISSSF